MVAMVVVGCKGAANHGKNGDAQPIDSPPIFLDAPPDVHVADARLDAPGDAFTGAACNVLAQTGCLQGERCAWIEDNNASPPLGHIGCAPIGAVALGGTCMYGAPGATGYDNCQQGDVCINSVCKQICDVNGGAPMCAAGSHCGAYSGVFGAVGQPPAAGACDPACDPLADNDFLHNGTKTGTACAATSGCYGEPNSVQPTNYTCLREVNTTLVHRSPCTGACADNMGNSYLNGCAQGYVPLLYDTTGSMQVDCIAFCAPASCYAGHCGGTTLATSNLTGDPAKNHHCNTTDARGTFVQPTVAPDNSVDGEQCMYEWLFELGANGLVRAPTSDTVGYCVDHSKYKYDPAGGTNYTTPWNKCDTLANPGMGTQANPGAAMFGCVDTTTGGVMLQGKQPPGITIDRPHALYRAVTAP